MINIQYCNDESPLDLSSEPLHKTHSTEAACRHTSAARLGHLLCLCKHGKWGGVKIGNIVILQENTKCPHLILLLHQLSHCVLEDVSVLKVMLIFHPLSSYKLHHNLQTPGVLKPRRSQVPAAGHHFRIGKIREIRRAQNLSPDHRVGIDCQSENKCLPTLFTFSLTTGSQWAQGSVLQVLCLSSSNRLLVHYTRT